MNSIRIAYHSNRRRLVMIVVAGAALLLPAFAMVILSGTTDISVNRIFNILFFEDSGPACLVVWQIRLPRLIGALLGGTGLALAGAVLQAVLHNPLAAPTTLGIAQGAAFGASLGITLIGTVSGLPGYLNFLDSTTFINLSAFVFSLLTTFAIILLARLRRAGPESIILAGVALSSLFMAGTTFLQYFADETQLALIVHWTFGDLARASWSDLRLMAGVIFLTSIYFFFNRHSYNALLAGGDVAQSLGVNVNRLRLISMFMASLTTAVTVTFFGILGFIGLVAPHIGRRLIGSDNRLLFPLAAVSGVVMLLAADLLGQFVLDPVALPAGVVTSFFGTPVFLFLLFGKGNN
ncbi:MAG: iron ABC transporter permease [Deltaproteobacteria bacterium]|nr:iron ABC transporter permease [Candidatus Tharpella sp.]